MIIHVPWWRGEVFHTEEALEGKKWSRRVVCEVSGVSVKTLDGGLGERALWWEPEVSEEGRHAVTQEEPSRQSIKCKIPEAEAFLVKDLGFDSEWGKKPLEDFKWRDSNWPLFNKTTLGTVWRTWVPSSVTNKRVSAEVSEEGFCQETPIKRSPETPEPRTLIYKRARLAGQTVSLTAIPFRGCSAQAVCQV